MLYRAKTEVDISVKALCVTFLLLFFFPSQSHTVNKLVKQVKKKNPITYRFSKVKKVGNIGKAAVSLAKT